MRARWPLLLVAVLAGVAWAGWPIAGRSLVSLAEARIGVAPEADRAAAAAARVRPALERDLVRFNLRYGAPVFIRIFKAESQLEVWLDDGQRFRRFRTYPICRWSGALGPKQRQGDNQAPEGFYRVGRGQLNPQSQYHLSFNLGYPNAYDRAHARTGDYLMVHGNCVSIGCYAMGDAAIDEIYSLVAAALANGQAAVDVHAFPFRYEGRGEVAWRDLPWADFWRNLREGNEAFVQTGRPPRISVADRRYVVTAVPTPPR